MSRRLSPSTSTELPIAGTEFWATLKLTTPLHVLEADGLFVPQGQSMPSVMPGAGSEEDPYSAYGMWFQKIDYDSLGFPPPTHLSHWTEIGRLQKNSRESLHLLEFLKCFRRIVETCNDVDIALDQLASLSVSTPENQKVWQKYVDNFPDFPMHYFVDQLRFSIGVSLKHAEALIDAGFTSVELVRDAKDIDLMKIKGIGAVTVQRIRKKLVDPSNRFDME